MYNTNRLHNYEMMEIQSQNGSATIIKCSSLIGAYSLLGPGSTLIRATHC